MSKVNLANGTQVDWDEFSKWSSRKQIMSISPPNKGKKFGEEFKKKLSLSKKQGFNEGRYNIKSGGEHAHARKVMTPDGEFSTIKEAGEFYSVRGSTIRDWIKRGKSGFEFITAQSQRKPQSKKGGLSGEKNKSSRAVITPGGTFPTLKAAAQHLGITVGALAFKVKNCLSGEYRFAEEREQRKIGKNPKSRKVMTPDGVFESCTEAARHFGISGEGMRYKLKSRFQIDFYYC